MTTLRQFLLCCVVLLVISPLASFAAPVQVRTVTTAVADTPKAAVIPEVSTRVAKRASAPKLKCGDGREGPCVCSGTVGGSVSLRKSSISTTCEEVAKAFIFVDPTDTTTIKTGETKFIKGPVVATTKTIRSTKLQPLNCDHIVELQFVKEEIDKIAKSDAPRHTVMCQQIHSNDFKSKFFDVINSADNVVFAEGKVNNAKLIPVGNKKPKKVTAQAARGAVLYITQLLNPGVGEPSSNTIATKIETAMTNLMAGTGQIGFDQGFATRWKKRLEDSIVALDAAPKLVALRSATATTSSVTSTTSSAGTTTSSATATDCNANGKRPAPPASGTPTKKQKVRALVEFVENLARRAIGKAKPKASTKVTADSCPLPIVSSAKTSSKTTAKAAAAKPTNKVPGTSSKSSVKTIPKTESKSKTSIKPATKASGKPTAQATTKPSTKATSKPASKVTAKSKGKTTAVKPTSKAAVKPAPAKTTKPAAKKVATVKPITKVAAKPKAKAATTAKPATKAAVQTKPNVKAVKPAPKKTTKVAATKKVSAKSKPKVVKPKPKVVVKAKGKGKKL